MLTNIGRAIHKKTEIQIFYYLVMVTKKKVLNKITFICYRMVRFILKRHPQTVSDSKEGGKRLLKGTLEFEGTKLVEPDCFLNAFYFAKILAELKGGGTGDLVLAYGPSIRTKDDAHNTSRALEHIGVRHELRRNTELQERDLGNLAQVEYERVVSVCGREGIIHSLFYAQNYEKLMNDAGIPGNNYGEEFGDFITGTVKAIIPLWRLYKKPDDIVVLHTHALRGNAIKNVLHYTGYKACKDKRVVPAIFSTQDKIPEEIISKARLDTQSGYWWTEMGCGDFMTIRVNTYDTHVHVSDVVPSILSLMVKFQLRPRPPQTDLNNPLQIYTEPERAFLLKQPMKIKLWGGIPDYQI